MKTITFRQLEDGKFIPNSHADMNALLNHGFRPDNFRGPMMSPVYCGCGDAMLDLIPYFGQRGVPVVFLFLDDVRVTAGATDDIDRIMSEDWTPGESDVANAVSDMEVAARAFVRASRDHKSAKGELDRTREALAEAITADNFDAAGTPIVVEGEVIQWKYGFGYTSTPAVVFPDRKPAVAPTAVGAQPGDSMCG